MRLRLKIASGVAIFVLAVSSVAPYSSAHGAVSAQIAASPAPARSDNLSVDYKVFTNWCEANPDQAANWQVQLGYCIGYLQGLYWGQVISSPAAERPYCLPENLRKSDMVEALYEYASMHPGELTTANMSAGTTASLVSRAFKAHFTCP